MFIMEGRAASHLEVSPDPLSSLCGSRAEISCFRGRGAAPHPPGLGFSGLLMVGRVPHQQGRWPRALGLVKTCPGTPGDLICASGSQTSCPDEGNGGGGAGQRTERWMRAILVAAPELQIHLPCFVCLAFILKERWAVEFTCFSREARTSKRENPGILV